MNRFRADVTLVFVAMIWGSAFVAQKIGNATMSPLWFVAVRFLISAVALAPFAWREAQKSTSMDHQSVRLAAAVGLCLAVGACLQQAAMVTASVTNGGFLTAAYVVLVPLTAWLLMRTPLRPLILAAGALVAAGAYLLGTHGGVVTWAIGDTLLLVADVAWAFAITLVAMFMVRANRPYFLVFVQFATTGILALVAASVLENGPHGIEEALPALLFAAIISGGIAYTLQMVCQRYTPPAEAALIMSLESVFAAIAGALLLGERLTLIAALGCALIFLGVVISEVVPTILRSRAAKL